MSKRTWAVANPEKMSAAQQRRRARKLGAFVEDVDHAVVFERDAGVCGICNLPVGLDAWHLDHIKPLSKGGEHSYANTQVSHPTCNQRKGDSFQLTTQTQGEQ